MEYKDHKSDTIYTAFPIKKTNIKELENTAVVIWTTTPWTIPANRALAYNQSLDYLLIQVDDKESINRKIIIA